jgi:hypothetical protein
MSDGADEENEENDGEQNPGAAGGEQVIGLVVGAETDAKGGDHVVNAPVGDREGDNAGNASSNHWWCRKIKKLTIHLRQILEDKQAIQGKCQNHLQDLGQRRNQILSPDLLLRVPQDQRILLSLKMERITARLKGRIELEEIPALRRPTRNPKGGTITAKNSKGD